ncbi:MAG TPA: hypothetical protein PK894_01465 [Defluviitoga sp.]|nr:hypothetical protein [Defluviitoga sp.]HOP25163.1 hypothetical protein [Defluviitoga sp.]HPZ28363.1 hypothetical protein [Defluviitoga sp.]HQD62253.1 hypothetical protein [Defluviitoga sp.]
MIPKKLSIRADREFKAAIHKITKYKRYLIKNPKENFFGFDSGFIFLISSAKEMNPIIAPNPPHRTHKE